MERYDETGARVADDDARVGDDDARVDRDRAWVGDDDVRGHRGDDPVAREAEAARDVAAEHLERDHPARPQQPADEGFERGYDQARDTPEEVQQDNFARGIAADDPPGDGTPNRFSTGIEEDPANPENNVERRFSEGIERSPTSE